MPADGVPWLARRRCSAPRRSSAHDAVAGAGHHEIRLTGGEPLLRRGIVDVVAASTALTPRPDISLTTNGIGLAGRAAALAAAGLNRLNVSLDTLRPDASPSSPVATGSPTCWPGCGGRATPA